MVPFAEWISIRRMVVAVFLVDWIIWCRPMWPDMIGAGLMGAKCELKSALWIVEVRRVICRLIGPPFWPIMAS